MAIRRRFGNLAEILLKQRLLQQNAQQQSELVGQRQKELSIQNYMQSLTNEALKNAPLARRLQKAGMPGMDPLVPTRDEAIQGTSADIEKADTLGKVMTPQGVINDFNQADQPAVAPAPTVVDPRTGLNKPNPSAINDLLDQNYAKRTSLENAAPPVPLKSINPDTGVEQEQLVNPYKAVGGPPLPTQRNATQEGDRQATINDIQTPGLVTRAGQEAGARAKAELPYQTQLAQTRANVHLLEQQEMDKWRAEHPKATADQLNQRAGAAHALTMIDEVQQLMDEMDKRGMMGPLAGRGADLAADRIKSEDLFKNPQDAQLAAEFFSQAGFLNKLAQKVHAGTRGAASPQMAAQFEKLFSGIGDKSIVQGQLNVVKRVMQTYSDNPDAPPLLVIPGMEPGRNPTQPLVLDPSIKALLDRGAKH